MKEIALVGTNIWLFKLMFWWEEVAVDSGFHHSRLYFKILFLN